MKKIATSQLCIGPDPDLGRFTWHLNFFEFGEEFASVTIRPGHPECFDTEEAARQNAMEVLKQLSDTFDIPNWQPEVIVE